MILEAIGIVAMCIGFAAIIFGVVMCVLIWRGY